MAAACLIGLINIVAKVDQLTRVFDIVLNRLGNGLQFVRYIHMCHFRSGRELRFGKWKCLQYNHIRCSSGQRWLTELFIEGGKCLNYIIWISQSFHSIHSDGLRIGCVRELMVYWEHVRFEVNVLQMEELDQDGAAPWLSRLCVACVSSWSWNNPVVTCCA